MLQVIKAEEVRDGEPRWWLADEDRRLDYMKPEHLHLHPRSCAETTHAIVDRPAPTPTPAPGLDLDAVADTMRGLDNIFAQAMSSRDAEIARLTAELAAAHRIIAEQRTWLGSGEAAKSQPRTDTGAIVADVLACAEAWAPEARVIGNVRADEIAAMCHELAAARAVTVDVCRYLDCAASDLLAVVTSLYESRARAISDATAARGTVGGLLAAGEERESRAWSEKGKAPPGSCPFCASRISMVQRDGYFIARCSHRGCGAVGPRMRSVSRAADLFCQPPRREAQGMSCGPIVASPPRPRCSCTHEAGDSRCNVHPTCSECGASTTRPVDGCEACRGPLPKGG